MSQYEEIITTMGDLLPGDQVLGTDGEWYDIDLLPIHEPQRMFKIDFENGSVECSGDHEWSYYVQGQLFTNSTEEIFKNQSLLSNRFGIEDGPSILKITEIKPKESRCIKVGSEDRQFQIYTSENKELYTHNCQMRMVCGRLGRTASMMALESTLATTIDGEKKGSGIIASNGIIEHIQYYFAEQEWIEEWYAKRGLKPTGHQPVENELEAEIFDDFEGEEHLSSNKEVVDIKFAGVEGQVDKTPDQKFEEL